MNISGSPNLFLRQFLELGGGGVGEEGDGTAQYKVFGKETVKQSNVWLSELILHKTSTEVYRGLIKSNFKTNI